MVKAAEAGISPREFYGLTIGEITVAIEGYHERERQNLISRIVAIGRALSKGDPLKGLRETKRKVSATVANASWLWSKE